MGWRGRGFHHLTGGPGASARLAGAGQEPSGPTPGTGSVGGALASGSGLTPAECEATGRRLAAEGTALGEALDALRRTALLAHDREPGFDELRALAHGWSETMLDHLHHLTCTDPLTGLATQAHLRACLVELYRSPQPQVDHALVVTEARVVADPMSQALHVARLGEAVRSVLAGAVGRTGAARVVAITPLSSVLAARVDLLRRLVEPAADRVWVEPLPTSGAAAHDVLDRLCAG